MSRFFINLGELDGLHWKFLKDYLADISGISALHIFNVDVKKSFSFFESETKDAQAFLNVNAKELKFNERKVQIEASSGGGERSGGRSSESRGEGGYKRREGGGSSGSRGYAGKREGGSSGYPKRSSDSSSSGYKRRESEGGGSGYKRKESSSEGTGFKRRDSGSSTGGGGFKRKESPDGGFKKSFDKPPAGGSRPRTKRSFND
ncbi:MAG TPA: DbpA RNA binding domain-containing protein, partial [Bacteroidia bacterium]|nr:DbpA RNA binding domain-containing protein [Bacteroidia bacterium]